MENIELARTANGKRYYIITTGNIQVRCLLIVNAIFLVMNYRYF